VDDQITVSAYVQLQLEKASADNQQLKCFMAMHLKQVIAAKKGKDRQGREVHHSVWGTRPDGSTHGNLQNFVISLLETR